ncbi:winged helix-turn-helix transcriptional regulator [Tumebacillus sp. ITR2]|uniref:Winged helix-turn-helix transcriptional regulator n=1 Tax=Tumebacillus amylolyticus TaxID=2801339 RepID=A0ABS1JA18_9BACL|nr:MarR family transcriptional regulator [Tumebacillus amylolyticus]MBL0387117.1 winged helix-turn-helix transcriptional regulator [Tumebacillus amylolyticus]
MIKIPNLENIKAVSIPLRDFNKEVYKLIGQDAERVGITTQQLIVLFEVANNPLGGLEQLSETMQLSASTLSGIVDRLVKTELLVRERSERDRRHLELRISPAGGERVREAFNPETSVFLQRMSFALQLPEEDLQTMMRVQRQMLARIRGEDETTPSK